MSQNPNRTATLPAAAAGLSIAAGHSVSGAADNRTATATHTVTPLICRGSLMVLFSCEDGNCDYRGPDTSTGSGRAVSFACAAALALNQAPWTDTFDGQATEVRPGAIVVQFESPGARVSWRYGE